MAFCPPRKHLQRVQRTEARQPLSAPEGSSSFFLSFSFSKIVIRAHPCANKRTVKIQCSPVSSATASKSSGCRKRLGDAAPAFFSERASVIFMQRRRKKHQKTIKNGQKWPKNAQKCLQTQNILTPASHRSNTPLLELVFLPPSAQTASACSIALRSGREPIHCIPATKQKLRDGR